MREPGTSVGRCNSYYCRGPNPIASIADHGTCTPYRWCAFTLVAHSAQPPGDGKKGEEKKGKGGPPGAVKPKMNDTVKANVYADNCFIMCVSGKLAAVDSIDFIPHNVVSVDLLPEYPITIAVMAKDNADPKTMLEYGDHIGDGGFILKYADGIRRAETRVLGYTC